MLAVLGAAVPDHPGQHAQLAGVVGQGDGATLRPQHLGGVLQDGLQQRFQRVQVGQVVIGPQQGDELLALPGLPGRAG
jgi:hypothetical protein